MAVSNRIKSALTTTVLATAATGFMAGCGVDEDEEQVAYCTDENGEIVDDDFCDDGYSGGGLFFPTAVRGSTRGTARRGSAPVSPPPERSAAAPGSAAGSAAASVAARAPRAADERCVRGHIADLVAKAPSW
jgi:hypothetical protein